MTDTIGGGTLRHPHVGMSAGMLACLNAPRSRVRVSTIRAQPNNGVALHILPIKMSISSHSPLAGALD